MNYQQKIRKIIEKGISNLKSIFCTVLYTVSFSKDLALQPKCRNYGDDLKDKYPDRTVFYYFAPEIRLNFQWFPKIFLKFKILPYVRIRLYKHHYVSKSGRSQGSMWAVVARESSSNFQKFHLHRPSPNTGWPYFFVIKKNELKMLNI